MSAAYLARPQQCTANDHSMPKHAELCIAPQSHSTNAEVLFLLILECWYLA
jgi:hypothetical protein